MLEKLHVNGALDETTYALSISEPIPENPQPLPRLATHLLDRLMQEGHAQRRIRSSVDGGLQTRTSQAVDDHHQKLKANLVYNAAALGLRGRER